MSLCGIHLDMFLENFVFVDAKERGQSGLRCFFCRGACKKARGGCKIVFKVLYEECLPSLQMDIVTKTSFDKNLINKNSISIVFLQSEENVLYVRMV